MPARLDFPTLNARCVARLWARSRDPLLLRRCALIAVLALGALVVTGGAVRLSGSGLGCPTWPHCSGQSVVAGGGIHHAIELGNRLLTIAVFLGIALASGLALRSGRRDLRWLAWGLVAGYCGQAVMGGITVLTRLNPLAVGAHFLLSMVLEWNAIVLYRRCGQQPAVPTPIVRRELRLLARVLTANAALVLVIGTLVTGTGPHAGARVNNRLPFKLRDITELHSDFVLLLVGATVATLFALRVSDAPAHLQRQGRILLIIMLAQAATGFAQYFLGLPAVLVGVHIAGATLLWSWLIWFTLSMWERPVLAEAMRPSLRAPLVTAAPPRPLQVSR